MPHPFLPPIDEIEGDVDLHRFLGLGGPRAGFSEIRAKGWVRSPNASPEQLEDLCQLYHT